MTTPVEARKMARMRAVDAAVLVLEKEGISCAFGVPGAAINPLYSPRCSRRGARSAISWRGTSKAHPTWPTATLVPSAREYWGLHRHVRPGRHGHDHRPLFGSGGGLDPDPVHHGAGAAGAPDTRRTSRRSTSRRSPAPVAKWAVTVMRTGARSDGVFQQAFHVMRSSPARPGSDRPADRRADCPRSNSISTTYAPLAPSTSPQ